MIFDLIYFRIYTTKFPDPAYAAKVILIILQSLIMSSATKIFMSQVFGADFLTELIKNGSMRFVYLLPIVLCSIYTHFRYSQTRIDNLKGKWDRLSKSELNIRVLLSGVIILLLIFSPRENESVGGIPGFWFPFGFKV